MNTLSSMNATGRNRGFTLIELLIVVAIIAVLVAVLALAIFPWLARNNENSTRTLMNTVGPMLEAAASRVPLSVEQMRKDAGTMSSQIAADPKIASSQLVVFYFAPSQKVWEASAIGRNQEYRPSIEQKEWAKFIMTVPGGEELPYLADGWGTTFWYYYSKTDNTWFLRSAGKDMQWETDDDMVMTGKHDGIKFWADLRKA